MLPFFAHPSANHNPKAKAIPKLSPQLALNSTLNLQPSQAPKPRKPFITLNSLTGNRSPPKEKGATPFIQASRIIDIRSPRPCRVCQLSLAVHGSACYSFGWFAHLFSAGGLVLLPP